MRGITRSASDKEVTIGSLEQWESMRLGLSFQKGDWRIERLAATVARLGPTWDQVVLVVGPKGGLKDFWGTASVRVEVHSDASVGSRGVLGAFDVRRIGPNDEETVLAREAGRIEATEPMPITDITPAEGFAVISALDWLCDAERRGVNGPDEAILYFIDNQSVRIKLDEWAPWGRFRWLWELMIEKARPFAGRLQVLPVSRYDSRADRLLKGDVPVWSVPPLSRPPAP